MCNKCSVVRNNDEIVNRRVMGATGLPTEMEKFIICVIIEV